LLAETYAHDTYPRYHRNQYFVHCHFFISSTTHLDGLNAPKDTLGLHADKLNSFRTTRRARYFY
jgi:hypothetical protein